MDNFNSCADCGGIFNLQEKTRTKYSLETCSRTSNSTLFTKSITIYKKALSLIMSVLSVAIF